MGPWGLDGAQAGGRPSEGAALVAPVECVEGGGIGRHLGPPVRDDTRPAAALLEGAEGAREVVCVEMHGILASRGRRAPTTEPADGAGKGRLLGV